MLGYAPKRDCRTSFRLFCRTIYERSSESSARAGPDYVKTLVSDETELWAGNRRTPEKCVHETSSGGGFEGSISSPRKTAPSFRLTYFLVSSIPCAPSSHRFTQNPTRYIWLGGRSTLQSHTVSHPSQISESGGNLHVPVRRGMASPRWAHGG